VELRSNKKLIHTQNKSCKWFTEQHMTDINIDKDSSMLGSLMLTLIIITKMNLAHQWSSFPRNDDYSNKFHSLSTILLSILLWPLILLSDPASRSVVDRHKCILMVVVVNYLEKSISREIICHNWAADCMFWILFTGYVKWAIKWIEQLQVPSPLPPLCSYPVKCRICMQRAKLWPNCVCFGHTHACT